MRSVLLVGAIVVVYGVVAFFGWSLTCINMPCDSECRMLPAFATFTTCDEEQK